MGLKHACSFVVIFAVITLAVPCIKDTAHGQRGVYTL